LMCRAQRVHPAMAPLQCLAYVGVQFAQILELQSLPYVWLQFANAGAVIAAANAAMVSSLSIQITPNFCVESRGAQMAPLAPLASCKERQNRYDPRFMLAALPRGSCRAGLIKPGPKPKLSEHQRQEAGAGYEPCESARTIAKSFEVECLCQPAARPLAMRDFLWNWPKRSSGWSRKVGTS